MTKRKSNRWTSEDVENVLKNRQRESNNWRQEPAGQKTPAADHGATPKPAPGADPEPAKKTTGGKQIRTKYKPSEAVQARILARSHRILIGIDPGKATGFAIYVRPGVSSPTGFLSEVKTLSIYQAIKKIEALLFDTPPTSILVRVEDARLRGSDPHAGAAKAQGAGSVKRDADIWEEVLLELGVDFELLRPTPDRLKWTPDYFKTVTGWTAVTSNHARDAAALIHGL